MQRQHEIVRQSDPQSPPSPTPTPCPIPPGAKPLPPCHLAFAYTPQLHCLRTASYTPLQPPSPPPSHCSNGAFPRPPMTAPSSNVHTLHGNPAAPSSDAAPDQPRRLTACQRAVGELNGKAYAAAMAENDARLVQGKQQGRSTTTGGTAKAPFVVGSAAGAAGRKTARAPVLAGTTVRGTGRMGKPVQDPNAARGSIAVSSERGFGKVGKRVGKKGRAAALDAAEARLAQATSQ